MKLARLTDIHLNFLNKGARDDFYSNHMEQVNQQLERQPLPLPQLHLKRKPMSLFDYEYDDIDSLNYEAHPHIKAPVAV